MPEQLEGVPSMETVIFASKNFNNEVYNRINSGTDIRKRCPMILVRKDKAMTGE